MKQCKICKSEMVGTKGDMTCICCVIREEGRKKINSILDRLDYWMEQSNKWQKAMDDFVKVIAPSSYSPILEDSFTYGFIEGVAAMEPELKEHLEYYAYALPMSETAEGENKGKKYNLKNRDEYVEFILEQ